MTLPKSKSQAKSNKDDSQDKPKKKTDSSAVEQLEDQLAKAETAVRKNEFQVYTLHQQWITYLVRLSYMVLMISFHQLQCPSTACLEDVKNFNEAVEAMLDESGGERTESWKPIAGYKVIGLVLTDSIVHILAIVMACFLSFFLQKQQKDLEKRKHENLLNHSNDKKNDGDDADGDEKKDHERIPIDPRNVVKRQIFSDARYLMANACIAPLLAMYFGQRQQQQQRQNQDSCLEPTLLEQASVQIAERERSLPVVVVFHVLVTGCVWFMDRQQGAVTENVMKVYRLRRDLLLAQHEENKNTKLVSQHENLQKTTGGGVKKRKN